VARAEEYGAVVTRWPPPDNRLERTAMGQCRRAGRVCVRALNLIVRGL